MCAEIHSKREPGESSLCCGQGGKEDNGYQNQEKEKTMRCLDYVFADDGHGGFMVGALLWRLWRLL